MNKKDNNADKEESGIIAKKSLGQNFLNSDGALDAIIKAGRVVKGDTVLEIGPGKGALTKRLLNAGANVIAVEKDDRLIPLLEELFSKEIKSKKLTLIHGDVLDLDVNSYLLSVTSYKLIANIPYYITGEIVRKFLSGNFQPSLMVVLVQKEVAERITTKDQKESILSISVKAYGEPKYIQTVKAGSFFPPPKVDSAILLIDNISKDKFKRKSIHSVIPAEVSLGLGHQAQDFEHSVPGMQKVYSDCKSGIQSQNPNLDSREYPRMTEGEGRDTAVEVEQKFFEIVKTGFAHKRKTLSSNLRQIISKEKLIELGINENERAENLSLEQWMGITNNL